jgi:O-antigen/teichoic acid export membrane protein
MNEHRDLKSSGPRYLLSVIGFSSIPRVVTSVLTLISFPLVLRAIGAAEYGVFVYVSAVLTIVVLFADFGVAAAAGKAIAEARPRGPTFTRQVLVRCVRLQLLVGVVGLLPVSAISWLIVETSANVVVESAFLATMIVATWLAVVTAFERSCLQSYLAFGWLAVLDTVESSVRTIMWLLVAWVVPTKMGLALASLIPTVIATVFGGTLLVVKARGRWYWGGDELAGSNAPPYSYRKLLSDSASFMSVGLATRVFTSTPYIVLGRLSGAEVVGVVGAFAKLLEAISFPFITLGNALAVRAHEVKAAGVTAVVALCDACLRFVVIAAGAMGVFLLASDFLARVLVPDTSQGPALFSILSAVILTHSIACFVSPVSDFVGGIRPRMMFLTGLTIFQVPFLWIATLLWSERGGVAAYAIVNVAMIGGYIFIAKRVLLDGAGYLLPRYISVSLGAVALALVASMIVKANLTAAVPSYLDFDVIIPMTAYLLALGAVFIGSKELRRRFLSLSVFEFTRSV